METDYSLAADDLFEQTLHDYSTYLFRSRRLRLVSDDSIEPKYTRLRDPSGWRRFPLTDLLTVSGTTTTPPRDLAYCDPGSAPYVTTQATNNYGLKCAQKRLKRESLRLPCTRSGDPDWRYIEQYIGDLRYSANLREQG